ncbi:hypothetical protein TWF281_006782 [Arthrobotrys megalospora]
MAAPGPGVVPIPAAIPSIAPHTVGPFPVHAHHNQAVGPQAFCPIVPALGVVPSTRKLAAFAAGAVLTPAQAQRLVTTRNHNTLVNQGVFNNNRRRGPWGGGNPGCNSARFNTICVLSTGERPEAAPSYRCHLLVAYQNRHPDLWWHVLLQRYGLATNTMNAFTFPQFVGIYTASAGVYTDPYNPWV